MTEPRALTTDHLDLIAAGNGVQTIRYHDLTRTRTIKGKTFRSVNGGPWEPVN